MDELSLLVVAVMGLWLHESAVRVPPGWAVFLGGGRGHLEASLARERDGGARARWRMAQLWPTFGRVFLVPDGPYTAESPTDLRAIRRAVESADRGSRGLRLLGALQFTILCLGGVLVGGVVSLRGLAAPWIVLVLTVHVMLVVLAYARSRVEPRSITGGGLVMLAISPIAAMRSGESLHRMDLAGFDPVAIALVLASPQGFRRFARESLRALAEDRRRAAGADAAARVGALEAGDAALDRLFRVAGAKRSQIEDGMLIDDPSARSYCPSCGTAYALERGECSECAGVRLSSIGRDRTLAWKRVLERIGRRQARARR